MKRSLATLALSLAATFAHADVKVEDAWVRGTVPAQKATGAFMTVTSATSARLVEATSPVAGVTEVHEMAMDGSVMKMRRLDKGLKLPAGKPVELKPGGYHIMLMELKRPIKEGDTVPLTLTVQGADGQRQTIEVKAAVKPLGAPEPGAGHGHHHHH